MQKGEENMKVLIKNEKYSRVLELPINSLEIQDEAAKLRSFNLKQPLEILIIQSKEIPELNDTKLSADLLRLNFFAYRVKELVYPQNFAMRSMVYSHPKNDINKLISTTFGLESIPVRPCSNTYDLGVVMTQNNLIKELDELPEQYREYIDISAIGAMVQKNEKGVFIEGTYCVPSCYEEIDIQTEIGESKKSFFRLLIAPAPQNDEPTVSQSQWISLPQTEEYLNEFANELGEKRIEDCVLYGFESSISSLKFDSMQNISELNNLANHLFEMTYEDVTKLKAVIEKEGITSHTEIKSLVFCLDEYDFDSSVTDGNDYAKKYLKRNLPDDFNKELIDKTDFYDFGYGLKDRVKGTVTSYGIVSGRGNKLYEPILTEQLQEQNVFFEDEMQDHEFKMEGMSL